MRGVLRYSAQLNIKSRVATGEPLAAFGELKQNQSTQRILAKVPPLTTARQANTHRIFDIPHMLSWKAQRNSSSITI